MFVEEEEYICQARLGRPSNGDHGLEGTWIKLENLLVVDSSGWGQGDGACS